jgi:uncharacterized membrane protein YkgB
MVQSQTASTAHRSLRSSLQAQSPSLDSGNGVAHNAAEDVSRQNIASTITSVGTRVLRYGLALVIGWIGLMKFTGYEANGIEPLVAHSPFMSWMYSVLTVRQFSDGLGIVEVAIALLISVRPWSRKASGIGSAAAVLMFLTTLSFLFSTPGWEPRLGGFPALSGAVGQFLIKDVVLLGAAVWSLGESLNFRRTEGR